MQTQGITPLTHHHLKAISALDCLQLLGLLVTLSCSCERTKHFCFLSSLGWRLGTTIHCVAGLQRVCIWRDADGSSHVLPTRGFWGDPGQHAEQTSSSTFLRLLDSSVRGKAGNPKRCENECVIFKLPANSEHLVLQGGGRPRQWEPLSPLSTPLELPATRWTRRHVCVLDVCVWTNSVCTGMMFNRHR